MSGQLALGFPPPNVGGPHSHRGALPTSEQAAREIAPGVTDAQVQAMRVIEAHPRTADEVAGVLRWDRFYARPRVCELHRQGLIETTGETRPNESGKAAAVYRLTHAGRLALRAVA